MSTSRGISTIIGSVFFMVLMTAGLSVSYLVIETQSDMISAQQVIADAEIKKIQEQFSISAVIDGSDNNRLLIFVDNESSNPLEIDSIWIVNQTDSAQFARKHDVNYANAILPAGYGAEILQNNPLYMDQGDYTIKVVSAIGTIKVTGLDVGGANKLKATLIMDPPDVRIGENATAILHLTNSGNTRLLNVTSLGLTVNPPTAVLEMSPMIQTKSDLLPSESVILSWKYRLSGAVGTSVTFSGAAEGIDEPTNTVVHSNFEIDSITIRDSEDSTSVIKSELFARPELFMVIPSPFGDSNHKGLWGALIVNPTDQPIHVSKVVISAIAPRSEANDRIFPSGTSNPCEPETVPPTTNNWTCPIDNQLMWKNTVSPQVIAPKSVSPFLAKVKPGNLPGGSIPDPETVLIQVNAFTTLGQFGKAGYGSSMHLSNTVIPNVYLSKVADSTNNNDIIANMTGILPGETRVFNAVLADLDGDAASKISAGSRLIINIPRGWTDVTVLGNTGFSTPTYQAFPDGSSQIVGQLEADLDGANGLGKTITFSATAPPVASTQMYVMYILADGYISGQSSSIGPLAEVVLRVSPP